jgi:hypothetical protein
MLGRDLPTTGRGGHEGSSLSTNPPRLLNTSSSTPPPSPPPPTLLFYSSFYPLCLPFLIFVSFYIPEQIEVENKKKEKR